MNGLNNMAYQILFYGNCECIREPRGNYGLEGYQLGQEYRWQSIRLKSGQNSMRVFPEHNIDYSELCSLNVFNKHFKRLSTTPQR